MVYDPSLPLVRDGEVLVHEVTIPALGMAMTEAVLLQWHKQPGERVTRGEVLAEIETDKSNVDLESPADGVLGVHLVAEGSAVPIGEPVVRVMAVDETEAAPQRAPTGVLPTPASPPRLAESPEVATTAAPIPSPTAPAEPDRPADPPVEPGSASASKAPAPAGPDRTPDGESPTDDSARVPYSLSPRKRQLARLEAEAAAVERASAAASPAVPPPIDTEAIPSAARTDRGRYRGAIAERVVRSWQTIPHFIAQREIDAGEADSCLATVRQRDPDATLTDLLLRAYARAMTSVVPSSGDVGLAVATADGVMMPVVASVPDLDVAELVTRRSAAVRRAREGRLSAHDLSSTPVGSLSNLGARGVDAFTGIIPLGQQMLLTVGRVGARPVVVDGRLAVRTTVIATLNVDHRELDGDRAAQVLDALKRELGDLRSWAERTPA